MGQGVLAVIDRLGLALAQAEDAIRERDERIKKLEAELAAK